MSEPPFAIYPVRCGDLEVESAFLERFELLARDLYKLSVPVIENKKADRHNDGERRNCYVDDGLMVGGRARKGDGHGAYDDQEEVERRKSLSGMVAEPIPRIGQLEFKQLVFGYLGHCIGFHIRRP